MGVFGAIRIWILPAFLAIARSAERWIQALRFPMSQSLIVFTGLSESVGASLSLGPSRSVEAHYWLDAYNAPLLACFASNLR